VKTFIREFRPPSAVSLRRTGELTRICWWGERTREPEVVASSLWLERIGAERRHYNLNQDIFRETKQKSRGAFRRLGGRIRCYGTERMRQKLLMVESGVFVNTSTPFAPAGLVTCGNQ